MSILIAFLKALLGIKPQSANVPNPHGLKIDGSTYNPGAADYRDLAGNPDKVGNSIPGSSRLAACLAELAEHEGGYVNHSSDPGGPTNMGITQAALASWRGKPVSVDDVRNLTRAEAEAIYRKNYWQPIKGDALPDGVDLAVFDLAVNSGPAKAAMMLQAVVGAAQDGVIGPLTLAAVGKMPAATVITRLCADRLAFLRSLSTWPVFGRGWTARVEKVQAAALKAARP